MLVVNQAQGEEIFIFHHRVTDVAWLVSGSGSG